MEIKDYLKYYIGQTAFFDNKKWEIIGIGPRYILLRSYDRKDELGLKQRIEVNPEELKLELRRLSSITEEEAIDIYTLERDNALHHPTEDHDVRKTPSGLIVVRLDLIDVHIHIGYEGQIYKTIQPIGKKPYFEIVNNWPAIFHYLISKGFWLWHPEAFYKGLIIEKK